VQTPGDLYHQIRNTLCGQAQDIFDHPTVFNARNGVLDGAAHAGKDPIEQYFPQAQILVFSPFLG
jgi:hypothetical protein